MARPLRSAAVSADDRHQALLAAIFEAAEQPDGQVPGEGDESDRVLFETPAGLNPVDPQTPDPGVDVAQEAWEHILVTDAVKYLRTLRARDRMVIYLRYGLNCDPQSTFSTASLLRVQQETVTSIERRVLKELRLALGLGRVSDEPEVGAPDDHDAYPRPGTPTAPSAAA